MTITSPFLHLTFFLAALAAGQWQHTASSAAPEYNLIHRDDLAGAPYLTQEERVTRMLTRDINHMERSQSATHQGQKTLASGSGEFLATILAGSKQQPVSLIMDTTSEITWMKCAFNNRTLMKMKSTVFNNYNSTSYISIGCNNPTMKCQPKVQAALNNTQLWCRASGDCVYNETYRNVTISSDIAQETFIVNTSLTATERVTVRFGATHFTDNFTAMELAAPAHGVLALGPGPFSFASQVPGGTFSFCLGQHLNSSGRLVFGPPPSCKQLQCTYVGPAGVNRTLYEVKVKAIRVDKTDLKDEISASTWIVNSGQSFTFLPGGIYEKVVNSLNQWMLSNGYNQIKSPKNNQLLDHCYTLSSGKKAVLPQVGIVFDKGVVLESVGPGLLVEASLGVQCLSIVKNEVYPYHAVIGNLLLRDNWLQFGNKKLCFARAVNCTG